MTASRKGTHRWRVFVNRSYRVAIGGIWAILLKHLDSLSRRGNKKWSNYRILGICFAFLVTIQRHTTAPAHFVRILVDIRCGWEKKQNGKLGLVQACFRFNEPIYDQNCQFSCTVVCANIFLTRKVIFGPWVLKVGKHNLACLVVIHGEMKKVITAAVLFSFVRQ